MLIELVEFVVDSIFFSVSIFLLDSSYLPRATWKLFFLVLFVLVLPTRNQVEILMLC